jgi:NAD-dependent DNA ligase
MRRADAFALVRTHGGKPREGVTKHTDVLIVGELGWPLLDRREIAEAIKAVA